LVTEIRKLSRIAAAVGGFLVMMGMVLIGVFALALFNVLDIGVLADETHLLMLTAGLLSIGVLDVIAGVILWRG